jgi:hypothetical protein
VPRDFEVRIEKAESGWHFSVPKPGDARYLIVEYRAPPQLGKPANGAAPDAENARKRLAEANGRERYGVILDLDAEAEWKGVLEKPGEYRFLVMDGLIPSFHAVKLP